MKFKIPKMDIVANLFIMRKYQIQYGIKFLTTLKILQNMKAILRITRIQNVQEQEISTLMPNI